MQICLTHWDRVTHICVSDLTSIGSDNGLSPGRRQAMIRTNAGVLLIRPLGTNFSEFLVKIIIFSFKKMRLKVSSAKRRPFCLGLNELKSMAEIPFMDASCLALVCAARILYNPLIPRQNGCHFADNFSRIFLNEMGWVGLWGFLWWAPSAKRKDHHGVSSGWSSVWHRSNTDLSSTRYEQIPIILGVWPGLHKVADSTDLLCMRSADMLMSKIRWVSD